jgi:Zn-finger nucleic acid-binding protein
LPLIHQDSEGHVGAVCPKCHGTWVEYKYVEGISAKRRFVPGLFIEDLKAVTVGPTELACPKDSAQLRAAAPLGIALDWCPLCKGVWFDNGELKKLLSLHPHPGRRTNVDTMAAGEGVIELLFYTLFAFLE